MWPHYLFNIQPFSTVQRSFCVQRILQAYFRVRVAFHSTIFILYADRKIYGLQRCIFP